MIDIHSHILPGVDDGAQTERDSIAMALQAVEEGIETIIATPHNHNGQFDTTRDMILSGVDKLNTLFKQEGIPLTVLPGQENRINGDLVTELKNGELVPLNETKYLFVEFPSGSVPRYAKQMFFDIQVAGYIPVIVHPERNRELIEHPNVLYEFVKTGVLTQVTAASVVGKFGKNIEKYAHQLIESNQTHFIASDAHNTTSRRFCMQEAFADIEKKYGASMAYMFEENAFLLTQGENINRMEPETIRRKKFLGIF